VDPGVFDVIRQAGGGRFSVPGDRKNRYLDPPRSVVLRETGVEVGFRHVDPFSFWYEDCIELMPGIGTGLAPVGFWVCTLVASTIMFVVM
tara:strand:+ start:19771 stop:20040 length:270 start_codon:yes stop_codon:yes gene_type:complete